MQSVRRSGPPTQRRARGPFAPARRRYTGVRRAPCFPSFIFGRRCAPETPGSITGGQVSTGHSRVSCRAFTHGPRVALLRSSVSDSVPADARIETGWRGKAGTSKRTCSSAGRRCRETKIRTGRKFRFTRPLDPTTRDDFSRRFLSSRGQVAWLSRDICRRPVQRRSRSPTNEIIILDARPVQLDSGALSGFLFVVSSDAHDWAFNVLSIAL